MGLNIDSHSDHTRRVLSQLVEQTCCIELGVGSFLSFFFGNISCEEHIRPKGVFIEKTSDFLLWVQMAAWRIDLNKAAFVNSSDDREKISESCKFFEKQSVLSVVVLNNWLDLEICFTGGFVFRTFSYDLDPDFSQWDLFTRGGETLTASFGEDNNVFFDQANLKNSNETISVKDVEMLVIERWKAKLEFSENYMDLFFVSQDQKKHRRLSFDYSVWRALDPSENRFGFDDTEDKLKAMKKLFGLRVLSAFTLNGPFKDLKLIFDGGFVIENFASGAKEVSWSFQAD